MEDKFKLINFTELTLNEKEMILGWRNHPEIKKWMYTTKNIQLSDHLSFIEKLKTCNDKIYFLVKHGKEYLGVIDFYNLKDTNEIIEFGLYSNPNAKIPGVGRILEKLSIEYAFDVLKAKVLKLEVFSENMQVRNLHKKFHFKEVNKKIINNKEVICMELKNENR